MRIDAPEVSSPAEATSLMLHHLQLAAAYFEATDDDDGAAAKQMMRDNEAISIGSIAFIDALCKYYKEIANVK